MKIEELVVSCCMGKLEVHFLVLLTLISLQGIARPNVEHDLVFYYGTQGHRCTMYTQRVAGNNQVRLKVTGKLSVSEPSGLHYIDPSHKLIMHTHRHC